MIGFERVSCDLMSRYTLDDEWRVQTFLEERGSGDDVLQDPHSSEKTLSWVPDVVKDFILPAGFPGDYLFGTLFHTPGFCY